MGKRGAVSEAQRAGTAKQREFEENEGVVEYNYPRSDERFG